MVEGQSQSYLEKLCTYFPDRPPSFSCLSKAGILSGVKERVRERTRERKESDKREKNVKHSLERELRVQREVIKQDNV